MDTFACSWPMLFALLAAVLVAALVAEGVPVALLVADGVPALEALPEAELAPPAVQVNTPIGTTKTLLAIELLALLELLELPDPPALPARTA